MFFWHRYFLSIVTVLFRPRTIIITTEKICFNLSYLIVIFQCLLGRTIETSDGFFTFTLNYKWHHFVLKSREKQLKSIFFLIFFRWFILILNLKKSDWSCFTLYSYFEQQRLWILSLSVICFLNWLKISKKSAACSLIEVK